MTTSGRSWLEALAAHPVFRDEGACAADPTRRNQLLAVRGTELIVVVQNEVRLTSLAHAKRALSGADAAPPLPFKVLASDTLDFPITGLAVNPTGKLLAIYGSHEVVMAILPRRGYLQQVGAACAVKALRVGAYYHAPHGCAPIAQVAWHPLGRDGASLLVLTDDALLREYDVLRDLDEPQQTIACVPDAGKAHAALSAEDEDASCAVAFALGDAALAGASDAPDACAPWLLLTLFVLMRNGDVWAVCPVLPKAAAVPRATVHALARADAPSDLARRYAADLARQLGAAPDAGADTSLDDAAGAAHGTAHVVAPASVPHRVAPQGPFLQRPAPVERSDEVPPVASDLFFTRIPPPPGTRAAPLDVLGVGTRDGGVQLGLLAQPIAPRWLQRTPPAAPTPPALVMYESIALPLEAPAQPLAALQEANVLQFVLDPLYPDTVLVTHLRGVHRIALRWAAPLLDALAAGADHAAALVERGVHSEVTCLATTADAHGTAPVVGAALVHDVYLSYTLFAITSDTQLVALEFALRTAPADVPTADVAMAPAYATLLDGGAFAPPAFPARAAPPPGAAHARLAASAEALRAFGGAAEQVRARMRDVVGAARHTQGRVERQVQEMQRQVEQLAEAARRIDALGAAALPARLARLEAAQRASIARTDALLQQLMDEHQPQLSVHERRWLSELERMAREFGVGDAPRAAAREQLHKLEHQLEVLRPSFPRFAARQRDAAPHGQRLGTAQLQRVEALLANEARLLAQARAKMQWIQQALASG